MGKDGSEEAQCPGDVQMLKYVICKDGASQPPEKDILRS